MKARLEQLSQLAARGMGLSRQEKPHRRQKRIVSNKVASAFLEQNQKGKVRVFVAGGSRSGRSRIYVDEAFLLGQVIGKNHYRMDFGLSSQGIMGAVARGVLQAWSAEDHPSESSPIHAVTTKEYLALYKNDDFLKLMDEIIVAHTLEERKQRLLNADFVIFTPGGVGTLDELAYDCVAMQDGFLKFKPFILFNIDGFFHHLLEYLKEVHLKGFSDPMPFIVVDNSLEAGIAFEMIGRYYSRKMTPERAQKTIEQIIHDLPYIIDQKMHNPNRTAAQILDECDRILTGRSKSLRQKLKHDMEQAYLDKEITRMYDRLAKSGRDTAAASYKLTALKYRSKRQTGG